MLFFFETIIISILLSLSNSFIFINFPVAVVSSIVLAVPLLDAVANHIALDFEQNYAGKVVQDESGRALFKASIISYLTELQNAGAIINFNSTTDVMVEAGEQVDAYYSEIYIQPTYSVDKLYMIVNVR